MSKKFDTYKQLTVWRESDPENKLTLTFVEESVLDDTVHELRCQGFKIDQSPGYQLYRNADDALKSVAVFLR